MNLQITKYKKSSNYSYSLGATVTIELIKYKPDKVIEIFINEKTSPTIIEELKILSNDYDFKISQNTKIFHILSDKENCFVIGVFEKYQDKIKDNESHICLVNPTNAGNLGTIIRSCLGFDIKNISIIAPNIDHFEPKVIRSSMGAIFNMKIEVFPSFEEYKTKFLLHNFFTFMLNGSVDLRKVDFNQINRTCLVFGNEQTGLPEEFENIGTRIKIHHSNRIDSLNLAQAVNIALYQLTNEVDF